MNEITKEEFWKLEDLVASCEMQKATGQVRIIRRPDGSRIYVNLFNDKLFQYLASQNLYFATRKIINKFLR